MTTDDTEIVSALQAVLADKVGKQRFDMWFGANTRLRLVDQGILVTVSSQFYQDWLRTNFRRHIEESCQEALGKSLPVSFQIDASLAAAPAPTASDQREPASTMPLKALPAPPRSRRRFAEFADLAVGEANAIAVASAKHAVDAPGRTTPLVLHGPTGVGKTHLLEAICAAAQRRESPLDAVYLSSEQFTNSFLEAMRGGGLPSFRRMHRSAGVLIIDDVQFLRGKKATIVELQSTVDALAREGKQLVFAADRPPAELSELGPEMVSRLSGGLVCGMEPPDYSMRLSIVRTHAARLELRLPEEVAEYIAAAFSGSARELLGAVNRLHAVERATGRRTALASAEEALADVVRHAARSVKLADIQRAVCDALGLTPQTLQAADKARAGAYPRMLAMYLARKHTRAPLSEIGEFFGRRSHSTVISAQKKINRWMSQSSSVELAGRRWKVEDAIRKVEQTLRAC